jgi:hypothetical protein
VEGEPPPKPAYSELIGRLLIEGSVSESEIDKLPDPDLLRDAMFLVDNPSWTQRDLDEADSQLLDLMKRLRTPVKRGTDGS